MTSQNRKLYLFEAIELRDEYDRQIQLFENLLKEQASDRDHFFNSRDEERREPAADFDPNEIAEKLKKLQTRRVRLNQAIQAANFHFQLEQEGQPISLAEALEIRKNLLAELKMLESKVLSSAYKKIIHKEKRDIVLEPRICFRENLDVFLAGLTQLRHLVSRIHSQNHQGTVVFNEE